MEFHKNLQSFVPLLPRYQTLGWMNCENAKCKNALKPVCGERQDQYINYDVRVWVSMLAELTHNFETFSSFPNGIIPIMYLHLLQSLKNREILSNIHSFSSIVMDKDLAFGHNSMSV